ncbi:MAG TPA: ribonuclease HII [Terriglobia bacterium]|nr:ribonuclease HII [Terriglobia bacterium]
MPRIRDEKDLQCTWRFEKQAYSRGWAYVAGCDEAGRGALLGPLYAAAVILDPSRPIAGLNDSKKLSPQCREALALEIRAKAVSFQVVAVSAEEVDAVNVYQASRLAMIRAIERLKPAPHFILTDAMPLWEAGAARTPFRGLIHGDARSVSIAAASILAKVARDAHMQKLDSLYPHYHLAQNKGYGTPEHLKGLQQYGPCREHRKSFQPVKDYLLPLFDPA